MPSLNRIPDQAHPDTVLRPPVSHTVQAIVFDYGNTLIPFGRAEVDRFDIRLKTFLQQQFGPFDELQYHRICERDRLAPYQGNPPAYRESDLNQMVGDLFAALYRRPPIPEELQDIIRFRRAVFVEITDMAGETRDILKDLRADYRLGLLSNYPDGEAIRQSLRKNKADLLFDAVLVSGDIGLVKPHPEVFRQILRSLDIHPSQCLFVGDNWLADVQGARRAGMIACHFTKWVPPERFDPTPEDLLPHATIRDLSELRLLLPTRTNCQGNIAPHG